MCLCRHGNEYIIIGRDYISPLEIWLKMSLNVYFGFCESLVPPLKGAVGLFIKCVSVSVSCALVTVLMCRKL